MKIIAVDDEQIALEGLLDVIGEAAPTAELNRARKVELTDEQVKDLLNGRRIFLKNLKNYASRVSASFRARARISSTSAPMISSPSARTHFTSWMPKKP